MTGSIELPSACTDAAVPLSLQCIRMSERHMVVFSVTVGVS